MTGSIVVADGGLQHFAEPQKPAEQWEEERTEEHTKLVGKSTNEFLPFLGMIEYLLFIIIIHNWILYFH
jgi:hypothetical protein